ncbi:MAG: hypothetical protein KDJ88_11990 [Bauldia sp.]|nr:hypothetical protein [Bauldia sp.]
MNRTFLHSFDPSANSPITGGTVDLDVLEIEDAGIREVLQTPGAAYGAWSILDKLLTPTGGGTPFIFREPLGQAREVKVALSGLFGRFVARAYLKRHMGLSIFAHLGNRTIDLDGRRKIQVKRLSRGDLPDWIACAADFSSLTIAEAKGCHDRGGPEKALDRAWAQAKRIDITANGHRVTVKRIAIATRWGVASTGPTEAHLSVRDPVDGGESLGPEEEDALFVGLLRQHIANLIRPLGHAELADALQNISSLPSEEATSGLHENARTLLDLTKEYEAEPSVSPEGLIGGVVTRAGPLSEAGSSNTDQEMLARLNLRPVFVGVERDLVRAIVDEEPQRIRTKLAHSSRPAEFARGDPGSGWIIPLGEEQHVIRRD